MRNFGDLEMFSIDFYRAMLCMRGTSHACVRLSVRPSVTSRCCTKTAQHRITKQHRAIAHGVQFSEAEDLRELRSGSPPRSTGAPDAGVVGQNRRLLTNNWLYLENGTR